MAVHALVDESKERGLKVAVALVAPGDLRTVRATMSGLRMRGQSRIHFKKESPARRRHIVKVLITLPVRLDVYDATSVRDVRQARFECLTRIVADLASRQAHRLVVEQDDSLIDADRRVLFRAVHAAGAADRLAYVHMKARSEPLLWIPDAAAWCWTRGGSWQELIAPNVQSVTRL